MYDTPIEKRTYQTGRRGSESLPWLYNLELSLVIIVKRQRRLSQSGGYIRTQRICLQIKTKKKHRDLIPMSMSDSASSSASPSELLFGRSNQSWVNCSAVGNLTWKGSKCYKARCMRSPKPFCLPLWMCPSWSCRRSAWERPETYDKSAIRLSHALFYANRNVSHE